MLRISHARPAETPSFVGLRSRSPTTSVSRRTIFDGTKLPLVWGRFKTTTYCVNRDGYLLEFNFPFIFRHPFPFNFSAFRFRFPRGLSGIRFPFPLGVCEFLPVGDRFLY
jgi:hypothetical protein